MSLLGTGMLTRDQNRGLSLGNIGDDLLPRVRKNKSPGGGSGAQLVILNFIIPRLPQLVNRHCGKKHEILLRIGSGYVFSPEISGELDARPAERREGA
jgi:hypothetical protein